MTCYIVTFETSALTRVKVVAELMKFASYCPIHDNCWAVYTDSNATQIRDKFNYILGVSDRLFVIRSGTEAAWNSTYGTANAEWLKKNL